MSAPILRSAALQRALSLVPMRRAAASATPAAPTTFASVLNRSQPPVNSGRQPTPRPGLVSVALKLPSVAAGEVPAPLQSLIQAAAQKYGIDPALLAAVAKTESNFNLSAQSQAGAKGLMQLMDSTARGLGVSNSLDPAQNLDGGARFLSGLLTQFKGDVRLALAAYNAGPVAVQRYGGIPPYQETQRYVPEVLAVRDQFSRIWANPAASPPATLQTT